MAEKSDPSETALGRQFYDIFESLTDSIEGKLDSIGHGHVDLSMSRDQDGGRHRKLEEEEYEHEGWGPDETVRRKRFDEDEEEEKGESEQDEDEDNKKPQTPTPVAPSFPQAGILPIFMIPYPSPYPLQMGTEGKLQGSSQPSGRTGPYNFPFPFNPYAFAPPATKMPAHESTKTEVEEFIEDVDARVSASTHPISPVLPSLTPASTSAPSKEVYDFTIREGEVKRLKRLGLGKAIDATHPHPWASKSAYQAKDVTSNRDLVITTEGHHVQNSTEVVQNYFDIQGSLESSLAIPNQPIGMGVAADVHRSQSDVQIIRGKTVSTRTISFKIVWEGGKKTRFEQHLEHYLEREKGLQQVQKSEAELCYEFLKSLGGVTHYISSVTLGAMEYSVQRLQVAGAGGKVNSRAGFGPYASYHTAISGGKGSKKAFANVEKIGRIHPGDNVRVYSEDEAVILYSFTPVTNLVSNTSLQKCLQKAIQYYISFQLRKINGPYLIMTPERNSKGEHIYWKIVWARDAGEHRYFVRCTTKSKEASTFYIRPDFSTVRTYFFITTFVDGERSQQQQGKVKVERYIHLDAPSGLTRLFTGETRVVLEAKSSVKQHHAQFELIDRRDRQSKALMETDWLPDAADSTDGQPFFLRHYYQFSRCLAISGFRETEDPYYFALKHLSDHKEGKCHMLFQLIPTSITDPHIMLKL